MAGRPSAEGTLQRVLPVRCRRRGQRLAPQRGGAGADYGHGLHALRCACGHQGQQPQDPHRHCRGDRRGREDRRYHRGHRQDRQDRRGWRQCRTALRRHLRGGHRPPAAYHQPAGHQRREVGHHRRGAPRERDGTEGRRGGPFHPRHAQGRGSPQYRGARPDAGPRPQLLHGSHLRGEGSRRGDR